MVNAGLMAMSQLIEKAIVAHRGRLFHALLNK
jgi:hypothetical protein